MKYKEFLESKIVVAEEFGIEIKDSELSEILMPHQKATVSWAMEGDIVDDPFGGLFSTAYMALKMKRKAISAELNPDYYDDGLFYLKALEHKLSLPTLFDLV